LSEGVSFSSKNLKGWLQEETKSVFVPVHMKAEKLLAEMTEILEDLLEVSRMLLDNSAREIEKRNKKTYKRARALNKLGRLFVDRHRRVKAPDTVSFASVNEFLKATEKAFNVTDVDVRNWFPRVSPFFILDRRKFQVVFEKAKRLLKEFYAFQAKEYLKTKTLEDTFQLIDELLSLEKQLADWKIKMEKAEADRVLLEKRISEIERKITNLRDKDSLSNLQQTDEEIQNLRKELKSKMRHLRKPFIKFRRMLLHTGGLTPEESGKLVQYMTTPFSALASEKSGYPLLKEILKKLGNVVSENKIKLKHDKKRKAKEAITRIVNKDSLKVFQKKCKDVTTLKTQLSTSTEVTTTKQDLLKLQDHLEHLLKKRGVVETEKDSVRRTFEDVQRRIIRCKNEIETNILDFLNRKIDIK
jgi:predicted  nucleic acid-binding Zn-ribbon protein